MGKGGGKMVHWVVKFSTNIQFKDGEREMVNGLIESNPHI
jgi:hypothetical protein